MRFHCSLKCGFGGTVAHRYKELGYMYNKTKPCYSMVMLLVPAILFTSLFFYPDITRNLIQDNFHSPHYNEVPLYSNHTSNGQHRY